MLFKLCKTFPNSPGSFPIAIGTLTVVGLAGLLGGPLARATANSVLGLDVYSGNGVMNWSQIAATGVKFAFIKATEGVGFKDPQLQNNETNGTAAGMYIGAYDFAHPEYNTPLAEADYFVNYASRYDAFKGGHLVPALDLETGGGAHVGASSLSAWVNDWCGDIHTLTGARPAVYSYQSFISSYLNSSVTGNPLWIADWTYTTPMVESSPWTGPWNGSWTFWQYSDQGSVNGDPAQYVDLNAYNGSLSSLIANEVIPVPEPATQGLFTIGGMAMVLIGRRRKT